MTKEEIEAGKTPAGGYTRKQLEAWGVAWPAQKGWRKALLRGEPSDLEKAVVALRTIEDVIFAKGAPLGSAEYFAIRKACADILNVAGR